MKVGAPKYPPGLFQQFYSSAFTWYIGFIFAEVRFFTIMEFVRRVTYVLFLKQKMKHTFLKSMRDRNFGNITAGEIREPVLNMMSNLCNKSWKNLSSYENLKKKNKKKTHKNQSSR